MKKLFNRANLSFFVGEVGIIHILPLLVIIAAVGIISFLLVSSTLPLGGIFGIINPKPASQAASYTCGQITGFSVTSEIFWGSTVTNGVPDGGTSPFQGVIGNNNWQLYWGSGGAISRYADPNNGIWTLNDPNQDPTSGYHIESRCSTSTGAPEIWAQMISDTVYSNDPNHWQPLIVATINNIHSKFPSVRQIYLSPLAIMRNHQTCPTSDPESSFGTVRATYNEDAMMTAISNIVSSHQFADVAQGYIPYVNNCSEYRDWGGHLIGSTAARLSSEMGTFYQNALAGGSPFPSPTPTATPHPTPSPTPLPPGVYNIFGTQTPPLASDTNPYELGVKFRSSVAGQVIGVRFYKGASNTGSHSGSLWNSSGTRLATATFTGETSTGWQQVNFSSPVIISANTTYVASYFTSTGGYAQTANGFSTAVTNSPLTALQNGTDGGNGVYSPGSTSSFPNQTFNASNYWVDVIFNSGTAVTPSPVPTPTPAPQINFGGRVYIDSNGDGQFQTGEAGVSGRVITLTGSNLCTTGTDGTCFATGRVVAGQSYTVAHTPPAGYINTSPTFLQVVATGSPVTQLVNFGIVAISTPVPTPTPAPLCPKGPQGDANCDGAIDIFDYSAVITHFNQSGTNIAGDVNKDGVVDIFDYSLVVTHFGQ